MKNVSPQWVLVFLMACALLGAGCIGLDEPQDPTETGGEGPGGDGGPQAPGNTSTQTILETTLTWEAGTAGCTTIGGLYFFADAAQGIDHDQTPIPQEGQGKSFNATISSDAPFVEWGVTFWNGEDLAEAYTGSDDTLNGTVSDPSDTAILWSCAGAQIEVAFAVKNR